MFARTTTASTRVRTMRLGLDIGGTKTDVVAVTADGTVVARERLATATGNDGVLETAVTGIEALLSATGATMDDVESVGVGIPGQVVPGSGRVAHAVNLGVERLDLAAELTSRVGVDVTVENDVKAAAFGAYLLRGIPGTLGFVNLGTGIAAGIVADGEPWRGIRGAAGEIGHLSVDPAGPLCRCGQRGCIEALAGGGAVAARWGRSGALPVRDIFDAADAGNPDARELRAGIARGAAAAVRVLVLTADVDTVVLGGGLTALGARLLGDLTAELRASAESSAFMTSLRLTERIELLPAGAPAAALGAAMVGAVREREDGAEEALIHG